MTTLHLADADATAALGAALARTLPARAVVHLRGDLGAGKTTLARGLLRELGVQGAVRSPTYTLVECYPTAAGEVLHLDLYRIADAAELAFLGVDEAAERARLILVEWPERGGAGLPAADLELRMRIAGRGRDVELVAASASGAAWQAALPAPAPDTGPS
ncbi:MAG TPA: tRNA (adenosine(37)-N6)-threonylcarbamoyltransferase complex ATPase subunit type 1 TsaE [Xanthomonadaceae bacterium]|nr:tRNA (adenosine(37)-N6)-threonylcarbamoyltransferase complex ATPase subunit type 1 TsaE [Xanthomonadaceae bacterium]